MCVVTNKNAAVAHAHFTFTFTFTYTNLTPELAPWSVEGAAPIQ